MINNIKDYNKIGLNPYIKFSIVLILIYVFRTQYWFNELIHNFFQIRQDLMRIEWGINTSL